MADAIRCLWCQATALRMPKRKREKNCPLRTVDLSAEEILKETFRTPYCVEIKCFFYITRHFSFLYNRYNVNICNIISYFASVVLTNRWVRVEMVALCIFSDVVVVVRLMESGLWAELKYHAVYTNPRCFSRRLHDSYWCCFFCRHPR